MLLDPNPHDRSDRRVLAAGALLLGLTGACTQLDVGLGPGAAGSGSAATTTATDTTTGVADGTGVESSAPSSGGTMPTDETGPQATGDPATASGTDGGETLVQVPCDDDHQQVCAHLELDQALVATCGETISIKGFVESIGDGRWAIQDCGYCEQCAGPTYELEILAPGNGAPAQLPACSRIAMEIAPSDAPYSSQCRFTGLTIWEDTGMGENPAPVYLASSIIIDPPSWITGLDVTRENTEPQECDEPECCLDEPGKYTLTWSGVALSEPLALDEKNSDPEVYAFGETYEVLTEKLHWHRECDKQFPHFDWIFRR
ncbi:MAG: hypothetical protein AAGF11_17450 [Myxococcota bacterium]